MMATFSGVVLVSGTEGFATGASFELVQFEGTQEQLYIADPNMISTITGAIIELSDYILPEIVRIEPLGNQLYGVSSSFGTVYSDVVFVDGRNDFTFAPLTGASGITVLNFGFGSGFTFVVPMVSNRRVFPTAVEFATLFPGDVPRGSPLNP